MPAGSLASVAADSAFPALAEAMTEGYVVALMQRTLGLRGLRLTGIDVLNHKPGRRCTFRYSAMVLGSPVQVVAKWYRDLDEARRLFERHAWLAAQAGLIALPMPRLLGFDGDRGVILQEYAEGRELRGILFEGDLAPVVQAGRWLAGLHSLTLSPKLDVKDMTRELRKARRWAAEVSIALPALQAGLDGVYDRMAGSASSIESVLTVIHRDFYPANLLWDGAVLRGIDFDQMAIGDPAVDVGAFISQTEKIALRDGHGIDAAAAIEKAFIASYAARSGDTLGERLPLFRAYTLLHVASAEVRRRREGWQALTEAFVRRAVEVIGA